MNLAFNGFTKFTGQCLIGEKAHAVTYYNYESAKHLYCVTVLDTGERIYTTNMKRSEKTCYHEEIEKYFSIQ